MADKTTTHHYNKMPADKHLQFDAKGTSTLIQWEKDLSLLMASRFGWMYQIIALKKVPEEWTTRFAYDPSKYGNKSYNQLDALTQEQTKLDMQEHDRRAKELERDMPKFIAAVIETLSESSLRRIKDVSEKDFDEAIQARDVAKVLQTIIDTHTFMGGKTHSIHDQEKIRLEWAGFKLEADELLAAYYNRYRDLFARIDALAIKGIAESQKVYKFLSPLCTYKHCSQVVNKVIEYLAVANDDKLFPKKVDDAYKTLRGVEDAANIYKEMTDPKPTQGVHSINGYPRKKDNSDATRDATNATRDPHRHNVNTEAYLEYRMARDPNMTRKQLLKRLRCRICNKGYHVESDCRAAMGNNADSDQEADKTNLGEKGPAELEKVATKFDKKKTKNKDKTQKTSDKSSYATYYSNGGYCDDL